MIPAEYSGFFVTRETVDIDKDLNEFSNIALSAMRTEPDVGNIRDLAMAQVSWYKCNPLIFALV